MRLSFSPHRRCCATVLLAIAGTVLLLLGAGAAPLRIAFFHVSLTLPLPVPAPPRPAHLDWGQPQWTLDRLSAHPADRAGAAAYRARLLAASLGAEQQRHLPPAAGVARSVAEALAALDAAAMAEASSVPRRQIRRPPRRADQVPPRSADQAVTRAIWDAALMTGVAPDYLWRVGDNESALNPLAGAATSSARGLYQFIEATWLMAVKQHGSRHGLGAAARAVSVDTEGRPFVSDPSVRRQILALRYDPRLNAALAAEHTRDNALALSRALGRAPDHGELYTAHVLGARGALVLFRQALARPTVPADRLFPAAARSNPGLFYIGGAPRSAAGLAAELARRGRS